MPYIKVDNQLNGTILEISDVDITGLTATQENLLVDYDFPSQPPYFYRWDGSEVVVNEDEDIIFQLGNPYRFRIYDYMQRSDIPNYSIAPKEQNYNILGLFKKLHFDRGELKKVEYYGNYVQSADTFHNLVICEHREYFRVNELINRREMKICWIDNLGLTGATKQTTKFYTQEQSIQAGERRRRNIISNIKVQTIGLIAMTSGVTIIEAENIGKPLLIDYSTEINLYIEGSENELKNALLNDTTYDFLDNIVPNSGGVSIRLFLVNELTIDYTKNNIYI